MKLLDPKTHGVLDYLAVALLLVAPTLFGFAGAAATLCYVVAAMQLGMSLITAYPLSVAKVIPFTAHGAIELGISIFLVLAPWMFGFFDTPAARNFFLVAGVGLLLVYAVTNYKAGEPYRRRGHQTARVPTGA